MELLQGDVELECNSQRPKRIIIDLVRFVMVTGTFNRIPFLFQPFGLESIQLGVKGIGEGQSYNPSSTTDAWLARPYALVAAFCERYNTDDTFPVTMERWKT